MLGWAVLERVGDCDHLKHLRQLTKVISMNHIAAAALADDGHPELLHDLLLQLQFLVMPPTPSSIPSQCCQVHRQTPAALADEKTPDIVSWRCILINKKG